METVTSYTPHISRMKSYDHLASCYTNNNESEKMYVDTGVTFGCAVVVTSSKPSSADDTSYPSACLATDIGLARASKHQFPAVECCSSRLEEMRTAPTREFLSRASKSHVPAHLHDCCG
jgi:hypothetical protein